MRGTTWTAMAALVVALGVAEPADAQRRGNSQRNDRSERIERDRDDDRRWGERVDDRRKSDSRSVSSRAATRRNERGNGPSFCRSGRGHPVFGWDWCDERGWDRSGNSAIRWQQRTWEDVIFRTPRGDKRATLDRGGLGEVLGDIVFGRIDTRRRELSPSTDYVGRWSESDRGRELRITAGGVPVARLIDRDGDGRVDAVFTAER